jgi:hypothetical protein
MSRRNLARHEADLLANGQAERLSDTICVDIVGLPRNLKVLPQEAKLLLAVLGTDLEEVWRAK